MLGSGRRVAPAALAVLVALGAAAQEIAAPEEPAPLEEGAPLEFRDAELGSVVEAIGTYSGRTILLDPGVSGRITLSAPGPVEPEEALEVLRAALQLSGFTLVDAPAGALKVVTI